MAETDGLTGKRGRKAAIKATESAKDDETPAKPNGKRPNKEAPEGIPTFWNKQNQIAKADWGPRANIYLYRIEPITDRTRSGTTTYITKYAEPITEDRVLADHGSGKYKALLNFRKPGADQGDELDSIYFEMLNLQFPPKIPPGEWVDDPRNKKWAWAKQHYAKEQGNSSVLEAVDVLNSIRQDVIKEVSPKTDPTDRFIEGMKFIQSGQPQKSATEELSTLVTVAEKLRPTETVPAFVQAQFAALQAQIASAQERGDKLMMMVLERSKGDNGGISVIKEVVGGLKDLLPEVKNLFPDWGGRYGPWGQLAVDLMPHITPIVSPFASILAQGLMGRMQGNGMSGAPPQQHNAPPQQQPTIPPGSPPAIMMPFLQMIAFPMITHIRYCGPPDLDDPAEVGKDFARWVYNGFGSDPRYEQAITAARAMGPVGIVAAFRSSPLWNDKGPQNTLASLAELELKLTPFFTAFLTWNPEADEEPEEQEEPVVPEVLTYSGV